MSQLLHRRKAFRGGWTPALPTTDGGASPLVYVAADLITGLADGAKVAQWTDAGPAHNNLLQATELYKPTYKTGIVNGLPIVRFAGAHRLTSAANIGISGAGARTYVIVSRRNGGGPMVSNGVSDLRKRVSIGDPGYGLKWYFDAGYDSAAAGAYNSAWDIHCVRYTGAAVLWSVNNVSLPSPFPFSVALNTTNTPLKIAWWDGPDVHYSGDMAECVVYGSHLSAPDTTQVLAYLAGKYGITLS